MKYQKAASKIVDSIFKKSEYTLEHPLFLLNPYGTMENGLYLRYTAKQPCQVGYTIYVDHETVDEYSQMFIKEDTQNESFVQEGLITGLIPGCRNYLKLSEYDEFGKVIAEQVFLINLEDLKVKYPIMIPEEKTAYDKMSSGVFWMLTGAESKNQSICALDQQGITRIALKADSALNFTVTKAQQYLAYPMNRKTIVMINGLSQAEKIFRLGDYRYESGLLYQKAANSLYLIASDSRRKSKSDLLLKVDIESGEVTVLIDFEQFMTEKGTKIRPDSFGLYGDQILVNSQEDSSIYCLKVKEDEIETLYILTDLQTESEDQDNNLLYEPIGSFDPFVKPSGIQVNVNDEQLLNGQYYITMLSGTETNSSYYEIFVDENTRTYTLANRIDFDEHEYGISAQSYGEHEIILVQDDKQKLLVTDEDLQEEIRAELTEQYVAEYNQEDGKVGEIRMPQNSKLLSGVKKMKLSGVFYQ